MGIQFTRQWLNEFVDSSLSNEAVGACLTQAGLELDALTDLTPALDKVVVGHISTVEKHPDAEKLQVCMVDVGSNELLQIVCGCATVQPGLWVAVAQIGAKLPGGMKIKKGKLRGVISQGMLCSAGELGLNGAQKGIIHLEGPCTPGVALVEHLSLADTLFDFDVTPNRGDYLSVYGVARELAAFDSASHLKPRNATTALPTVETIPVQVNAQCVCGVSLFSD